jgi:hypothetical protein
MKGRKSCNKYLSLPLNSGLLRHITIYAILTICHHNILPPPEPSPQAAAGTGCPLLSCHDTAEGENKNPYGIKEAE